jgi:dihydrodipicolinate synthase/N-acetylneuraminate lyase
MTATQSRPSTSKLAPLTRQTLRGVWCALITPWTDRDELDEARYVKEIRAYGGKGVHGIYTGGTTGEFYAQDDATFERVTKITCDEGHAIGVPVQIGCTTLSTRTAKQRIRLAKKAGADGIQIALPFWLETKDDEAFQFVRDIAAEAAPIPIILYLTSRSKRKLTPQQYGQLAAEVPSFIGSKDTGAAVTDLQQILENAPDLAIFGGDNDFIDKIPAGGTGGYCSVTGLNTRRVVEYYNLCAAGKLDQAKVIHEEIAGMMEIYIRWVNKDGLMDSAIDRVQRVAGGVDVGLNCQAPYRRATQEHVKELVAYCKKHAPRFLDGNA